MNTVCRDIFRAVHEGKWLSIEYKNGKNEITKYWIGIISINPIKKSMEVQGLHLAQYTIRNLYVFIDSIQSSCVIEGSYFEPNQKLIDDIKSSPNLCVNSSFSYVVLSTLLLSSKDLTEWSLVYHSTLSYQRFYDLHSIHYDHLEGLHQLI